MFVQVLKGPQVLQVHLALEVCPQALLHLMDLLHPWVVQDIGVQVVQDLADQVVQGRVAPLPDLDTRIILHSLLDLQASPAPDLLLLLLQSIGALQMNLNLLQVSSNTAFRFLTFFIGKVILGHTF